MKKSNALKFILPFSLILGIFIYQSILTDFKRVIVVNKAIGIKGKVTGYNRARGYKIYIDKSNIPYKFDNFQNDSISKNESLGYYVDYDDSIDKNVNSDTLKLTRHGIITLWHYSQ